MDTKRIVNTFTAEKIKDLKVSADCANVVFQEAPENEIRVEAENLLDGTYICEVIGNQLVISYDVHGKVFVNIHRGTTKITLYLPTMLSFEHIQLDIGAGDMDLRHIQLTCESLEAEIGAGKWEAKQLTVSGRLHIEIGVGMVNMKKTTVGSLDINCGAGSCTYKGRVNGDMKLDCGVGSCKLCLDNKENDFNYTISCPLGRVCVNGNRVKAFGSEIIRAGKGALGTAVLECGMGNIEVETN